MRGDHLYPPNRDVIKNFDLEPMPGEEFRDVVGFDGLYSISNYGRVKREFRITRRGQRLNAIIMKPYFSANQSGVNFTVDCRVKRKTIQQLVAEAFIGFVPEDKLVMHKNKDASDNRLCNLEITSMSTSCKVNFKFGLIEDSINTMAVMAIERGIDRHNKLDIHGHDMRICRRCGEEKNLDEFPRNGKDSITCLQCVYRDKTQEFGIKKVREDLLKSGIQRCSRCKETLPLDKFYPHPAKKSKRDSQCKKCHKERRILKENK